MDAADRALLTATVTDALAHCDPADADATLAQLGWHDMLAVEPFDAVAIVCTELGRSGASATALDDVLLAALGVEPDPHLAVVLPPFGKWEPPGRVDDRGHRADGLATRRAASAERFAVVCRSGASDAADTIVTLPRSAVDVRALQGIDPDAGFHTVHVEQAVVGGGTATAWPGAAAAGMRAVGHQTAGACRAMLDLARTHALEREQFGRPIARFQAVRHRLADALVAIETLEATLAAADGERGAVTAALAKATAGRSARVVATNCQQVLAGIGFTTDHPFHRYLKRTMLLNGLFGTADDLARELGRRLVAERRVPTLIEL